MIGVLGATGSVGLAALRELRAMGFTDLRLGGRRTAALHGVADELGGGCEPFTVDADDPEALRSFARGCAVVLNCAGPTYRLVDTVAVAALAEGAHYVDVAGDDPAAEKLTAKGMPAGDSSVVLSAGALPGLSSLLPRWAARRDFERVTALTAHTGGMEECSPTVAADMMLSLTTGGADGAAYGQALAAWRDGRREPGALRAVEDAAVPGFPDRAALVPFLSGETERLAADIGLVTADWFNVYPGPQVRAALGRLPGQLAQGADTDTLAEDMIRAANLDLAGRSPYYAMVFTLTGESGGRARTRRVTVRTPSSYRLTAAVGALAVRAVASGQVPPGLHFACDALDPEPVVAWLRDTGVCDRFDVTVDDTPDTPDTPGDPGGADHEEGTL
ncbi:saccharopine dehydrogenase NADP-binding domain-containing protein [Yinghuangia sp. YIM S10712]|uniref:saccharopine dehydrogenase NADP-binding domain-containing protein n=1 Tax=Yinghuangia sp. YIM S10712 TaxID=3436930 RepID=UPI003F52991F